MLTHKTQDDEDIENFFYNIVLVLLNQPGGR